MTDKSNIFLSHASPEDNEFTRWLASKLILSGYKVWYDLEYLKGGEYFWKKIENVIRNESIRLIAILSENSYKKDGVRNEWDLGIAIENYIPNFVIPVLIDGFNSRNLPINLYQKNCIEFSNGWHKGLVQLLDTLDDAQIIKQYNVDPVLAKACLPNLPIEAINWVHRPEILESNWFNIVSLPPAIETTEILGPQREIQFENETRQIPWFEFGNKIIGFAPRSEIVKMFKSKIALSAISAIDTETFLNGQITWGEDKVTSYDAFNRVGYLIQQAWDLKMEKIGLISYELSNNKLIWYVPFGLIDNNKMEFKEWDGKRRKKQLAGTSGKYKVNWHYAISMQPILFLPRRIQLQAHIVFTDSNYEPIQSKDRMHQLRRSFCKSWWNDRWRGFLHAFINFAANGEDKIILPVGGGRSIQISAFPITFIAPRSLSEHSELIEDEEIKLDENENLENIFDEESLIQYDEDME